MGGSAGVSFPVFGQKWGKFRRKKIFHFFRCKGLALCGGPVRIPTSDSIRIGERQPERVGAFVLLDGSENNPIKRVEKKSFGRRLDNLERRAKLPFSADSTVKRCNAEANAMCGQ